MKVTHRCDIIENSYSLCASQTGYCERQHLNALKYKNEGVAMELDPCQVRIRSNYFGIGICQITFFHVHHLFAFSQIFFVLIRL